MSPILNYTTTVDVDKTVAEILTMLAKAGARQIMAEYDAGGRPSGVMFSIEVQDGQRSFRLPVHTDRVHRVILRDAPPRYHKRDQAERVGWRIAKDWLEAQLAIVSTEMVTLEQVMLPYMRTGEGQTFFDLYIEGQLGLPALGVGEGAS